MITDHGLAILLTDMATVEASLRQQIEESRTAAALPSVRADEHHHAVTVLRHVMPMKRALEGWITTRAIRASLAVTHTGAQQ